MQETEYINVYGARVHNLKDIDAEIPRNSFYNGKNSRLIKI